VEAVVFWFAAVLAVAGALGIVLQRNPFYSVLALVVHLIALAVLFLLLNAEFLAAAQVIVYAGAIMVLFVFAIMVLIPGKEETGPDPRRGLRAWAIPVAALLFLQVLIWLLLSRGASPTGPPPTGGVEVIGRLLFTDYLFPFELTSVLLLAAMVGVLLLARRRA
jgi:NADH-quinone oxidoreductase subunit J